ncbi:membrane protein [Neptunitalea chrysea]|uniref:Membrane protein n=1 Tax=Neptunitalea chrysea TaxID=1647581 RepID=A0A9W6EUL8_9FLAO|nr:BatA domain-containing protein [Neptunitalea chrysea]GLB51891.1 membrane protein [Neptunitalea chrysea]
MQFKHPELFWALLLLIIPILIHLFQLRRFQKVWFTNVAFLSKIKLQTRKSEKLKKWVILLTRLLALAAIIFAFTEPYFIDKNAAIHTLEKETVIYLDNSFSMQAKGKKGPLFERAVLDILSNIDSKSTFTLYTNDKTFKDTNVSNVRNTLTTLPYSNFQLDYNQAYLKGLSFFTNKVNTEKHFIFISDFQVKPKGSNLIQDPKVKNHFVQLTPENLQNISINTIRISKREAGNIELASEISSLEPVDNITVSLTNNNQVIGKTAISLDSDKPSEAIFTIPEQTDFNGYISLKDENLSYDNSLYFSLQKPKKINILTITDGSSDFLKRLYEKDEEFNYEEQQIDQLDFNSLTKQNLIILNQLDDLSSGLITTLQTFVKNGGHIMVIPSSTISSNAYNQLLHTTGIRFGEIFTQKKYITTIKFEHPLYADVFEKSVTNFQYPSINSYYSIQGGTAALTLENENSFLTTSKGYFVFSAPINQENSNFTELRDLFVPTLYNIGKASIQLPTLYYTINNTNIIEVSTQLPDDTVLEIKGNNESFIPLQEASSNKVKITTKKLPELSGNYTITYEDTSVALVSYNYNRDEGNLTYQNLQSNQINTVDNIPSLFNDLKSINNNNELWKWFIIFAVICLCIEMFIIKFLK